MLFLRAFICENSVLNNTNVLKNIQVEIYDAISILKINTLSVIIII